MLVVLGAMWTLLTGGCTAMVAVLSLGHEQMRGTSLDIDPVGAVAMGVLLTLPGIVAIFAGLETLKHGLGTTRHRIERDQTGPGGQS